MKHNRFASIGLILAILCTCLMGAVAEEEREIFTDGEYQYALLDDGTAEITKYSGKEKKLFIPVELGGKKVTSIGDRAFLSCDTLRIPLIIVPNPATSPPPTRISRKSAIQAHCLHAK